jgi:hypothetical protein
MYGVLEPVWLEATNAAKFAVLATGGDVNCFKSCGDVCWWCECDASADVDDEPAGDVGPLRTSLIASANVVVLKPPVETSKYI